MLADSDNSESLTFIDYMQKSCRLKMLQRASSTKWALALGTRSQSSLLLQDAQAIRNAFSALLMTAQI